MHHLSDWVPLLYFLSQILSFGNFTEYFGRCRYRHISSFQQLDKMPVTEARTWGLGIILYEFDPNDVKIFDMDSRWLQRGIKEAYYIAALDPDLNQDQGWHTLSPVDNSIKSCDRGLPHGSHD